MSYSDPRYSARYAVATLTDTGTWPATASAAVGTCTDLTFVLPRIPHPVAIVGGKIYRTGTGGTFTGVKVILYNGTNALGTSTGLTFTDNACETAHFSIDGRARPFYATSTDTAVATLTMKLTGTTTASIAATNEIIAVVFDTVEEFVPGLSNNNY